MTPLQEKIKELEEKDKQQLKVPEVTVIFWIVKILATTFGIL